MVKETVSRSVGYLLAGSNPALCNKSPNGIPAFLAQLVEHPLCKMPSALLHTSGRSWVRFPKEASLFGGTPLRRVWSYSLVVRTGGFEPLNPGSIPGRTLKTEIRLLRLHSSQKTFFFVIVKSYTIRFYDIIALINSSVKITPKLIHQHVCF